MPGKWKTALLAMMAFVLYGASAYCAKIYYPDPSKTDQGFNEAGTIYNCIQLSGNNPATIILVNDTSSSFTDYKLGASGYSLEIPSNIHLKVEKGARILKNGTGSNGTVEFKGSTLGVEGKFQIFSGFAPGQVTGLWQEVYPEWWGAVGRAGDTNYDDYNAVQCAVNSIHGANPVSSPVSVLTGKVVLSKYYRISKGISINRYISFEGLQQFGCGLYVKDCEQSIFDITGPAGSNILATNDTTYGVNSQIKNIEIIVEDLSSSVQKKLNCIYFYGAEGSKIQNVSFSLGSENAWVKRLLKVVHGPILVENINGHYGNAGKVDSSAFYFQTSVGLVLRNVNCSVWQATETPMYFDSTSGYCDISGLYIETVAPNKPAIYAKLQNTLSTFALRNSEILANFPAGVQSTSTNNPIGILIDARKAPEADYLIENISVKHYAAVGPKFDTLVRFMDYESQFNTTNGYAWDKEYFRKCNSSTSIYPTKISRFTPYEQRFGGEVYLNNGFDQTLSEWVGQITDSASVLDSSYFYVKRPKMWPDLRNDNSDVKIKQQAGTYLITIASRDTVPHGGLLLVEHSHGTDEAAAPRLQFNWIYGNTNFHACYDTTQGAIRIFNHSGSTLNEVTYSLTGVYSRPIHMYKYPNE